MASGLIAGGAIAGVIQSVIAFNEMESAVNLSGVHRQALPTTRAGGRCCRSSAWPRLLYYVGTKKPVESPKP